MNTVDECNIQTDVFKNQTLQHITECRGLYGVVYGGRQAERKRLFFPVGSHNGSV